MTSTSAVVTAPTGQAPADPAVVAGELRARIDKSMSVLDHIQVDVDRNGVATLSGFINSESERDQAVKLARGTPGVTAVVEDLRVLPMSGPGRTSGF